MKTEDLVRVLQEVPEMRLLLLELAWKVVREDGSIDVDKLALHYKELEEAIAEAQGYQEATKGAVRCLIEMTRS